MADLDIDARRPYRTRRWTLVWVVALSLVAAAVSAQTDPPADPEPAPTTSADTDQVADLRAELADLEQKNDELQQRLQAAIDGGDAQAAKLVELQKQLAEQQQQIAAQQRQITRQLADLQEQGESADAREKRIADLEQMVVSLNNRLLELQDQLPDSTLTAAMEERLARLESSVDKMPELPAEVVGAGEFPGSLRIPGTDAQIKIGGMVKTTLVYNLDALATDDRFLTAGIPIYGTEEASKGARLTLSARSSLFNFDMRTPTGAGHVRAFIEGDFAGEGNTLRLRHAYGQYGKYLLGQTWSNLADPVVVPEQVDFEGLNAQVLLRKAQLRGIYKLGKQEVSLSVEDPSPDVTGATGISLMPDVVAATTWKVPWYHLRTAAVLRVLRAEAADSTDATYSSVAWGVSATGRINVERIAENDYLTFAINVGQGFGRYINDLGAVGGQDAVLDPEREALRPLTVFAGYVGYAHWWKSEQWRSTACFGYVHVDNLDIQPDDAYRETLRFGFNVIYSPAPRMDVGVEFLTGRRTTKDRRYGTANQIQLGGYFRF